MRPGRCFRIPPCPPSPRPHPPKNRSSSSLREAERPRSLLILLRADVTQLPACKFEKTPRRSSQRSLRTSSPLFFSVCFFYFVLLSFQRRGINLCSEWRRAGKKPNQKTFMPQGLALSTKHSNAVWLYHEIIIKFIIPLSPPAFPTPTTRCHRLHENC